MMRRVVEQLKSKDIAMELTDQARELLAEKGYDPALGARPLRRTIQRMVEDPLSEKLLWKEFSAGQLVVVDVEDGGIVFRSLDQPTDIDVPPAELAGKE
jgi:ATP-dependent Clp protease ATP-binding subunit ClpC